MLVMEYLTCMLLAMAKEPGFCFHPMCKPLRLTNFAFADDLLVFFVMVIFLLCKKKNHGSFKILQSKLSILTANLQKSNLFGDGGLLQALHSSF